MYVSTSEGTNDRKRASNPLCRGFYYNLSIIVVRRRPSSQLEYGFPIRTASERYSSILSIYRYISPPMLSLCLQRSLSRIVRFLPMPRRESRDVFSRAIEAKFTTAL